MSPSSRQPIIGKKLKLMNHPITPLRFLAWLAIPAFAFTPICVSAQNVAIEVNSSGTVAEPASGSAVNFSPNQLKVNGVVVTGGAGPTGPVGPAGAKGATGSTGLQGPIGLTGATGAAGVKGATGATGPQGPVGLTGAAGAKGATGSTGAIGPQGLVGLTGAKGATGAVGTTGPAGVAGAKGATGANGATGPQGPVGLTGPAGPKGATGLTGATGATGPAGPKGSQGESGTGVTGSTISLGDWDVSVGNYNPGGDAGTLANVLTFSEGGSDFLAMANDGADATGMQINVGPDSDLEVASGSFKVDEGNVTVKSGNLSVNGEVNFTGEVNVSSGNVNVNNGDVSLQGGNLSVDGDGNFTGSVNVTGDVLVVGTVNAQNISSQSINQSSDRNLKEKFTAINPAEVLARVVAMPITSWNFKQDASERHIGPMAQDFYAAFNVGPDDKHIATVDEGGVALAAIQGLNEKLQTRLQEKDAEFKALEKRMADLETLVKASAHP
jgi:hypothetical protein